MSPKIYRAFFFLGGTPDGYQSGYPHTAVSLAEGLRSIGWEISSDVKAWQIAPQSEFLFPGNGEERAQGADLVIMTEDYLRIRGRARLSSALARLKTKPAVYLDQSDLGQTTRQLYGREFRRFDAIYRCHSSRYFSHPSNVKPMVFGISERIRHACAAYPLGARNGLLWNFRKQRYVHTVRQWAEREVKPALSALFDVRESTNEPYETQDDAYDELMRVQTGGRHMRGHYENL